MNKARTVKGRVTAAVLAVACAAAAGCSTKCRHDAPEGFVCIESGSFEMGSPSGELGRDSDELQRTVTLTRAFLLQATEVTAREYRALMGASPSVSACGSCPVEGVTWYEAIAYANALSRAEGLPECYCTDGVVDVGETMYDCVGYRLPTEAEWEYAARAGRTRATYAGDLTDTGCSDTTLLPIAWFCGNSSGFGGREAGTRMPNAWGLYDMLGNVAEWTYDVYERSPDQTIDPEGASSGSRRVVRGGCQAARAECARAANREEQPPDSGYSNLGFRLARTLP